MDYDEIIDKVREIEDSDMAVEGRLGEDYYAPTIIFLVNAVEFLTEEVRHLYDKLEEKGIDLEND